MCSDSYSRQRTAVELAQRADVVILLDDGGGAAQSVFEVCTRVNERVHRVRSKDEIKPAWFDGAGTAAIIGGILVPAWSVEDVAAYVRTLGQ
jgi:4-hydroxy-3-methylbut-2-en-1-yl diphosphate reductase